MFITNSSTYNSLTSINFFFSTKFIIQEGLRYLSLARETLIIAIEFIKYKNYVTGFSTIWVPESICDKVTNILKEHSVNFEYYKVTKNLVHYFKSLETEKNVSNDIFNQ